MVSYAIIVLMLSSKKWKSLILQKLRAQELWSFLNIVSDGGFYFLRSIAQNSLSQKTNFEHSIIFYRQQYVLGDRNKLGLAIIAKAEGHTRENSARFYYTIYSNIVFWTRFPNHRLLRKKAYPFNTLRSPRKNSPIFF